MSEIIIRPATAEDAGLNLHFVRELAIYEKALHEVVATEEDLRRSLFDPGARAEAVICSLGDTPVGFALYFFSFLHLACGATCLFLEDLYVAEEHRGSGAGKALLKHLARLAVERGCGRFEWNVLDWERNRPSASTRPSGRAPE